MEDNIMGNLVSTPHLVVIKLTLSFLCNARWWSAGIRILPTLSMWSVHWCFQKINAIYIWDPH